MREQYEQQADICFPRELHHSAPLFYLLAQQIGRLIITFTKCLAHTGRNNLERESQGCWQRDWLPPREAPSLEEQSPFLRGHVHT